MIIPIEQQVTSLELSKKLFELVVRQDSLYFWKDHNLTAYGWKNNEDFYLDDTSYIEDYDRANFSCVQHPNEARIYAAYTVAEILEMLAKTQNEWAIGYNDCYGQYYIGVGSRGTGAMIEGCGDFKFSEKEFPVNALAEYLIYRIKKGLVKLENL